MRVAVLCPVQPTGQRIRTLAGIEALEWSRRHGAPFQQRLPGAPRAQAQQFVKDPGVETVVGPTVNHMRARDSEMGPCSAGGIRP
jgi:hypothetical protein